MNKLFALCLLITLISCGGNSESSKESPEEIIKRYTETLTSIEKGLTSIEITDGETPLAGQDDQGRIYFERENVRKRKYTVILKVEDGKIYTYNEETNLNTNVTEKKVRLESFTPLEDLREVLRFPNATVINDRLHFTTNIDETYEMNEMTFKTEGEVSVSVNLLKPLCDMRSNTNVHAYHFIYNGQTTTLRNVFTSVHQTCGDKLPQEELKKIDLTSIKYCEELNDGALNCEDNRDMSHLTL